MDPQKLCTGRATQHAPSASGMKEVSAVRQGKCCKRAHTAAVPNARGKKIIRPENVQNLACSHSDQAGASQWNYRLTLHLLHFLLLQSRGKVRKYLFGSIPT